MFILEIILKFISDIFSVISTGDLLINNSEARLLFLDLFCLVFVIGIINFFYEVWIHTIKSEDTKKTSKGNYYTIDNGVDRNNKNVIYL